MSSAMNYIFFEANQTLVDREKLKRDLAKAGRHCGGRESMNVCIVAHPSPPPHAIQLSYG
jgi:hypothetical protein